MLTLDTELSHIKGINKRIIAGLAKMGIATVRGLLLHLPARYDDFSQASGIADLAIGQTATVRGHVRKISMRRTFRRNLTVIEAVIADHTGAIRAVWFNQPYLMNTLAVGTPGSFAGKVTYAQNGLCLSSPVYEPEEAEATHTGGLIPIYPETKGVTSRGIRYLVKPILQALGQIPDCIPAPVLKYAKLPDFTTALNAAHFPQSLEQAETGKKRIAFEDLFLLQMANLQTKMRLAQEPATPIPWTPAERDHLLAALPFTLTLSQRGALDELLMDIARPNPMNRLLQGDVGSGKTVVVAIAALLAAKHGFQTAILAPTEVLARQHYRTIARLFGAAIHDWHSSVALMTGHEARMFYGEDLETAVPKARAAERVKDGQLHIVIGTHAILEKSVSFHKLALIAVDEQHRFGVEQRATLGKKTSAASKAAHPLIPHFLSMSATPIPRTLSLTVFGDLELSTIDELPAGRLPIVTKIVPDASRTKAYDFIRAQVKQGRQAFVICPRIERASADTDEGIPAAKSHWDDVKAVEEEYDRLAKRVFSDLRVGMLHGKMKSAEKALIMKRFADGELDILVATSVIEVGVDVPNASIMAIEDADRFGLAQLYQFRGRVGRGEHQSACLLFTANRSTIARERLTALMTAKNGFELAERDLLLRGPGEFLGQHQTGLPDTMMGALKNIELVKAARAGALATLEEHGEKQSPLLAERLAKFKHSIHLE